MRARAREDFPEPLCPRIAVIFVASKE